MLRWPIIRHVRYLYLKIQVYRWAAKWEDVGVGMGWPNESDLAHLQKIWEGKA
jgi:hypothetical protein